MSDDDHRENEHTRADGERPVVAISPAPVPET